MYAPKFRSWLSSEERFREALDYRLSVMADAAIKEIHEMAASHKIDLPEPPQDNPARNMNQTELMAMYQRQMLNPAPYPNWQSANPFQGLLGAAHPAGFTLYDYLR